jgi:hypothetical protein
MEVVADPKLVALLNGALPPYTPTAADNSNLTKINGTWWTKLDISIGGKPTFPDGQMKPDVIINVDTNLVNGLYKVTASIGGMRGGVSILWAKIVESQTYLVGMTQVDQLETISMVGLITFLPSRNLMVGTTSLRGFGVRDSPAVIAMAGAIINETDIQPLKNAYTKLSIMLPTIKMPCVNSTGCLYYGMGCQGGACVRNPTCTVISDCAMLESTCQGGRCTHNPICTTDVECRYTTNKMEDVCVAGSCVDIYKMACSNDTTCSAFPGYPKCYHMYKSKMAGIIEGVCSKCGVDADCSGTTPYCDNGTCSSKQCATDGSTDSCGRYSNNSVCQGGVCQVGGGYPMPTLSITVPILTGSSVTSTSFKVSWTAQVGVKNYLVTSTWRNLSKPIDDTFSATIPSTSLDYTFIDCFPETDYTVVVTAVGVDGVTKASSASLLVKTLGDIKKCNMTIDGKEYYDENLGLDEFGKAVGSSLSYFANVVGAAVNGFFAIIFLIIFLTIDRTNGWNAGSVITLLLFALFASGVAWNVYKIVEAKRQLESLATEGKGRPCVDSSGKLLE